MVHTYKLLTPTSILRNDGAVIPTDNRNADYQKYLVWLEEGNIPEPPDPDTLPTVEELREKVKAVLNPLRDTFINRLTGICLFTEYPSMQEECQALRQALLDITKDERFLEANTEEEMTTAILIRYREIALLASPTIRNVFRELNKE